MEPSGKTRKGSKREREGGGGGVQPIGWWSWLALENLFVYSLREG